MTTAVVVAGASAGGGCSLGSDNVAKAQQERLVVAAGGLESCRGQAQLPNLLVSSRPGLVWVFCPWSFVHVYKFLLYVCVCVSVGGIFDHHRSRKTSTGTYLACRL